MQTPLQAQERSEAGEPVRIFIADEQPLFREGVRLTFHDIPGFEVVGEAGTGRETLQALGKPLPQVCVVDANIPAGGPALGFGDAGAPGGIELSRMIKARSPRTGVIIVASYEDEEQLFQAIKVGAAAYCLRDIDPVALVDLVRRVHAGEYLINDSVLARSEVTERVLRQFRALAADAVEAAPMFVPLSAREIEILDYIAHGQSNKAIAKSLSISDQTVKNHITSILRKLSVSDRTQAVIYALRHKWIKL